jgi:double-stranded uracil-DNA glycosylase
VDASRRPTKEDLLQAAGKTVPDVIGPHLRVLFVGINPGLYSGATGHHFARPGNRFWKALHLSGFTKNLVSPFDERTLMDVGLGITNIVARSTASAAELNAHELREGARRLRRAIRRFRPGVVAFLGVGAYRVAFDRPAAQVGPLPDEIEGARAWLLPNPSGLNASYQLPQLTEEFARLRRASARGSARAAAPRARAGPPRPRTRSLRTPQKSSP